MSLYSKTERIVKDIWQYNLRNCNDVNLMIFESSTIQYTNVEMKTVLEYTLILTDPTLYQELYTYASKLDSVYFWTNLDKIAIYEEEQLGIKCYYMKWAGCIDFLISEKEFEDWRKQFIQNVKIANSKQIINSTYLKLANYIQSYNTDMQEKIITIDDIGGDII